MSFFDELLLKPYKDRIEQLEKEVAYWKSNHDNQVKKACTLIERKDLPIERVEASSLLIGLPIPIDLFDKNNALKEFLIHDPMFGSTWVSGYCDSDEWWVDMNGRAFQVSPTHYLPLPPTPKKGVH